MDWFTVDKQGLAKLLEKRGKAFAVFELIQNAWDTNAKNVRVTLEPLPGKALATLYVEDDDPEGFTDLAHSFTLFAESGKKSDPTKRGRFNLGEKLVLALCENAEIISTKGSVYFNREGRTTSRKKLQQGSAFLGTIRMTREELAEVHREVTRLIPPRGLRMWFNGIAILSRDAIRTFEVTLPTMTSDEEGNLRRTARKTSVSLHAVQEGETATLYEMGIPVVELSGGEKWHVNVHQKVPLNFDRDNVTPAYLRELRTYVLNETFDLLKGAEDAAAAWVRDASSDERVQAEAVEKVVTERFGPKRVIYDPSDREGSKLAVAHGYTVIPPGALSAAEWKNVKASGAALPAGKVTPSPKPYSPDGEPLKLIPKDQWSKDMWRKASFAVRLGQQVLGVTIEVRIANDPGWGFRATYGKSVLTLNAGDLGVEWFSLAAHDQDVLQLLIHEFGHHYAPDHLSSEYHEALCRLGAQVTRLALELPEMFAS